PRDGKRRNVAGAVLELAFPKGKDGMIPKLVVAGDCGLGGVARAAEQLIRSTGQVVGLVAHDGATFDQQSLPFDDAKRHQLMKSLLFEQRLQMLVATTTMRRAVRKGLLLDNCEAVAILPPSADGDPKIFAQGLDLLVKANRGRFVTWSDDTVIAKALQPVEPRRVILVATCSDDKVAAAHIARGAPAVIPHWEASGPGFTLYDRGKPQFSTLLAPSDHTRRPLKPRELDDRVLAAALAYASGLSVLSLEKALNQPDPKAPEALSA
ncbi:MAG: hypothetical protein AAFO01_22075, partial [Pseudomonadota bacterium]